LTPPKKTSIWKLYFEKYRDPIIQILLIAAVVSLVLAFFENEFIEAIGIFLAIFFATTVGFYFERDAAKKFEVLNALGEEQPVKVRRDGNVMEIPRREVVVGDIVLIEVGDEIPADGLLIHDTDLQINESSLTGEPICTKTATHNTPAESADSESTYPANMVLRSSTVMNGRGTFRVTAVGDKTEIGKVARKSTEQTSIKTPLNLQLDRLAKLISKVGMAVSIAAFVIFLTHDILTNDAVWQSHNYLKMVEVVLNYFMMAVTLIVMAVPEGLPMAITLSLALNMRRMLKSNNLVRKLHACETMGAVTVICTDKTGTLTQNKMQVNEMVAAPGSEPSLLHSALALNTTAELNGTEGIGNPTEVALLLWLQSQGTDYHTLRSSTTIAEQLPFSTERKLMATATNDYIFVKGAPEIILSLCQLTADDREDINNKLLSFQQKAMRTLAFAYLKRENNNEQKPLHSLFANGLPASHAFVLQAITGISDPIRPDVPAAVAQCGAAGIEVKIVTGDTSATALEIARQIGSIETKTLSQTLITGPEWADLSDEEAYQRAKTIKVMSRARPSDKQRLVEMLQKHGEVVAVTGDGTNDAPALNYAHVGLSLGSGTSVAKEASDMTLIDDSFSSIANAVMWGRSLYKNIQRFLFFQLVVNLTALLLVLGGAFVGTDMPLTVTQILWVNLIMDTFAAMALASLPPSREVMHQKPRRQSDFIINKGMGTGIIATGVLFFLGLFALLVYCERQSIGIRTHELTIFFTTFVMLQFWNLFNAKTLGSHHSAFRRLLADRGLLLVLLIILGGQWLIVTLGGKMFRTTPLSSSEWMLIIAGTSPVLWIGEVLRLFKRIGDKKNLLSAQQ
ncbi:MAG TPA: calcium-translocating P-type ATPase, PMCA-type, partial [Prevotella sp.]